MIALATILGFLPAFIWLIFYLKEDRHPEPKRLIIETFVTGAIFAILALVAELAFDYGLNLSKLGGFAPLALVGFALIEELAKFGAAFVIIKNNPDFDEPIDAMIYMVIAALGFATVENLGVIGSYMSSGMSLPTSTGLIVETISLRFIGATLLHTLTSASLGYWWAQGIRKFKDKKFLIAGLMVATGLHTIFNYLIINYEGIAYPLLFVILVGFFVIGDFEKLKRRSI